MINDELVKRAISAIGSSPANHQYFFDSLKSPDWIRPLREAGRFKTPAQILHEEGGIRFPSWPESAYLARMAALAPEVVRDVIVEAGPTDNERVHQDYVEAALHMPPQVACELAKLEARWIRDRERLHTLYPDKVGELAGYLADNGDAALALKLLRALLSISAVPKVESDAPDEEDDFSLPPEPKGKFDHWHYRKILRENLPGITRAAPEQTLQLLADLLVAAVLIHSARNHTPDEDYSSIWRPQVAHENHQDLKDALISAVRDAALQMSISSAATASAVELLLGRRWRIFRRLAAYVLNESPTASIDTVGELLKQPVEYADLSGSSPEFAHLLTKSFAALPKQDKEVVLGIIDAGPNLERFKKRREAEGRPATEEEVSELEDQWRISWLKHIKDALPEHWRERYAQLVNQFGEPRPEETLFGSEGSFIGPTSPKSEAELRNLSPDELLDFLQKWQSTGDWNGPSPEGLGRALSGILSAEPQRLAERADQLRGLDPTYVRSAIEGFREAVKNGKTIGWRPVLSLCEWIVAQPRELLGRRAGFGDSDPDWGWARTAVAKLVLAGLQLEGHVSIPIEERARVWSIVSNILDDPDPYENDRPYGQSMFPGSLSLNVARGVAIEAALDYGLWIRRQRLPTLVKEAGVLPEIPELRSALEKHLHQDRSPAVREVYGRRFPWLVVLDSSWAQANANAIFQQREDELGHIAWANYVLFCRPYDDIVPIMLDQYRYAINRIGDAFCRGNDEIDQHLAAHLMSLYWRGKLSIEDHEGILRQFFAKAPDKLRGHAIWWIGRGLYDANTPLPTETSERLKKLWDWRLSEARPLKGARELTQFGYWFASQKLGLEWSLTNLLEVLQLHHGVQPDHLVVEELARVAEAMPLECVQALGLMIEGDREGWSIYGWGNHPRTILVAALSGDIVAQEEATRVINLLGSRGHHDYRGLIQKRGDKRNLN